MNPLASKIDMATLIFDSRGVPGKSAAYLEAHPKSYFEALSLGFEPNRCACLKAVNLATRTSAPSMSQ